MRRALRTSIGAGLIAGSVDIAAACWINALPPPPILRAIASGLIGRAAVHGGVSVLALGLVLQWLMSILIAALFVVAAASFPVLRRRPVAAGITYGVVIFFVMNYAVVPLSRAVFKVHFSPLSFAENLLAMLLFGVIVAYLARRAA